MAYRLIDSNLEDPTKVDPLAAQATATGYDATTSEVNQPTDTVAGQLNTLLSSGSPYIERARYSAAETANSRGLLNSSMAAGAGEAAAIDAALPIASQDAGIFNTTRLTNQQYKNRASEFGANAANTTSMFNAGQSNQFASQRLGGEIQKDVIGAQTEAEKELIGAKTQSAKELAEQSFGFSSALSAQQYTQSLGTMAFQEQIDTRKATLLDGFNTAMAKLQADLTAKTILPAEYEQKSKLLADQQKYALETLQKQADINTEAQKLAADLQAETILPAEYKYKKELLDAQLENSLKLQDAQLTMAETLQKLKGEQAESVAAIEGTFKTLLQASASATNLFSDVSKLMAAIASSPDISDVVDPATNLSPRDVAINNMVGMLELGLTVIGETSDLDLAGLIDWSDGGGETPPPA